jgi:hypothetical protein
VHDCTVHNVNGLGVCIELGAQIDELRDTLEFSLDNFRTVHSCKVIWHQGNFAGVAFEQQPPSSLEFDVSRRAKLKMVK